MVVKSVFNAGVLCRPQLSKRQSGTPAAHFTPYEYLKYETKIVQEVL